MIVEVYNGCFENEKYSDNGVNVTIRRCVPDNEVQIKFEDDGGKEIFSVDMEWEDLKEIIRRLENNVDVCGNKLGITDNEKVLHINPDLCENCLNKKNFRIKTVLIGDNGISYTSNNNLCKPCKGLGEWFVGDGSGRTTKCSECNGNGYK